MPDEKSSLMANPGANKSDCAIDDSDDGDESYVEAQKSISDLKKRHTSGRLKLSDLPFRWSPFVLPLTESNVESCVVLDRVAFPDHCATREKFEYRLSNCSNICTGLFCSIVPSEVGSFPIPTLAVANVVETGRAHQAKMVMLGHIVATLGNGPVVTDEDMACPDNWRDQKASKDSGLGHKVTGRTVCIHSFAVIPKLQNCGLGRLLMKAYLQQINESGVADRIALTCQNWLVSYFERFGFKSLGHSKTSSFGGGGWHDMIIDLSGPAKKPADALLTQDE
ncbi:acetyltransferase [Colletotrichum graminicola M1.001]|uniref:Acetyltransferase n=1 Tax=Colletotrichum graminicola (strain M1.001 / M2 / FGSC 10212) TaxID=645133 RepID=E3Q9U1_COLGM|nr:acetyltransferase [Colletotrichum graminicola M1.001]EFQ27629.1 acetyltransferase [Colletotrichum graminicola M1.001]